MQNAAPRKPDVPPTRPPRGRANNRFASRREKHNVEGDGTAGFPINSTGVGFCLRINGRRGRTRASFCRHRRLQGLAN